MLRKPRTAKPPIKAWSESRQVLAALARPLTNTSSSGLIPHFPPTDPFHTLHGLYLVVFFERKASQVGEHRLNVSNSYGCGGSQVLDSVVASFDRCKVRAHCPARWIPRIEALL